jgi:hypothetical protein
MNSLSDLQNEFLTKSMIARKMMILDGNPEVLGDAVITNDGTSYREKKNTSLTLLE